MLILYINGGTYSLKSTPNDRFFFFEKLFMAVLIASKRRRNTLCILCLARGLEQWLSYYLLDYDLNEFNDQLVNIGLVIKSPVALLHSNNVIRSFETLKPRALFEK